MAGGNGKGNRLNQLYAPWGIYVDDEQTLYIANSSNHRIVEWRKGATSGQVVAGGSEQGDQLNQLRGPSAVIVDREKDSLIISDQGNRRVVQWPLRNVLSKVVNVTST